MKLIRPMFEDIFGFGKLYTAVLPTHHKVLHEFLTKDEFPEYVEAIILFGSLARRTAWQDSDIDIMYLCTTGVDMREKLNELVDRSRVPDEFIDIDVLRYNIDYAISQLKDKTTVVYQAIENGLLLYQKGYGVLTDRVHFVRNGFL